jgi:hypothetical protein
LWLCRTYEVTGFAWCFVKRQALKMLVSRSGLGALNVFAFGDVRHVAGGGVKKPPHPFALAF